MNDWAVSITVNLGDRGTDDLMFALLDDLQPTHGASLSGWPGGDLSVLLTIEDQTSAPAALDAGWNVLDCALIRAGAHASRSDIVGVEVMTTAEQARELAQPLIPPLATVADIAAQLGVTRQRASVLARSEQFPGPAAQTSGGSLWLQSAVDAFEQRWERRRTGRPAADTSQAS